jgi:hypothetical protein
MLYAVTCCFVLLLKKGVARKFYFVSWCSRLFFSLLVKVNNVLIY